MNHCLSVDRTEHQPWRTWLCFHLWPAQLLRTPDSLSGSLLALDSLSPWSWENQPLLYSTGDLGFHNSAECLFGWEHLWHRVCMQRCKLRSHPSSLAKRLLGALFWESIPIPGRLHEQIRASSKRLWHDKSVGLEDQAVVFHQVGSVSLPYLGTAIWPVMVDSLSYQHFLGLTLAFLTSSIVGSFSGGSVWIAVSAIGAARRLHLMILSKTLVICKTVTSGVQRCIDQTSWSRTVWPNILARMTLGRFLGLLP